MLEGLTIRGIACRLPPVIDRGESTGSNPAPRPPREDICHCCSSVDRQYVGQNQRDCHDAHKAEIDLPQRERAHPQNLVQSSNAILSPPPPVPAAPIPPPAPSPAPPLAPPLPLSHRKPSSAERSKERSNSRSRFSKRCHYQSSQ
jgi:hypothetical protein